jgi:serine phosphatase RsbU (regulator of sigma subunit)
MAERTPPRDAERELALTASLLDTVLRRAPVGFALLDLDLRVLRVNEALAELDGFPLEAHLGLHMGDLWPAITDRIGPLVRSLPSTGSPLLDFEVATENWQGRRIEALVSCYPVVAEAPATPPRIGVLVRDVTERNRMRALVEESLRTQVERQQSTIEVLQQGLLPRALPEVPGLGLSATYRAAARELRVGGDWFDVVRLAGHDVVHLAVGDVAGHGLDAVETMGQLRSAGRGWLVEGHGPGAVLDRLNRLMRATMPDEVATLALAALDTESSRLVLSLAGHLPPVHVRADGRTELLWGRPGPPLGVAAATAYDELQVQLDPGDTVVLYTDGLVERRDEPIDVGLERLAGAAGAGALLDPDALVDALLDTALAPADRFDDICVLAVRLVPDGAHRRPDADGRSER